MTVTVEGLSDAAGRFLTGPHGLLIGGDRVPSAGERTFETIDPSTGEAIAEVAYGTPEDVDRAVAAARAAFDEGPWRTVPAAQRERVMNKLADLIEAHTDELAELESLDNGKPVSYARTIDLPLTVAHFRYFAGWPTKIEGEVIPVSAPKLMVYTRKEPVGVCGQIIPWNFPLMMASWKVAPALAAGCTVVLKPAEQTPLTALRLGELALEAGLPEGVLNVVPGDGATGAAIVEHPGVDKIAFTGSTAVGREIGATAGRMLKRVTLELGGKSANLILPDANVKAAIGGSFQGIYFNSGQACNAGSLLYVHRDQFDEVVAALAERAPKMKMGPGLDPETQLGPLVSAEQRDRVTGYIEKGKAEGAKLATGGKRPKDLPRGYFIEPTVFGNVDNHSTIAREEIFGPVLSVIPAESEAAAVDIANDSIYGLNASVFTNDVERAYSTARELRSGTVGHNSFRTDFNIAFGGFKQSGIGREGGIEGLYPFLESKTLLLDAKPAHMK